MLKTYEVQSENSCLNKARADEMLFVLLARDEAAPVAIRAWIAERIRLGKNQPEDAKLREAEAAAKVMEEQRKSGSLPFRCSQAP